MTNERPAAGGAAARRRLAWFSPLPPVRTGIAGRSAELVERLRARGYAIDAYPESRAHDFVWRRRREPYDLVVYQFGNSSHHDYEWAYALQYPGLSVLHDTHLHHARAAFLLREGRVADYRREFAWNDPAVSPDAAEIAIAGFDSRLYYEWPFVRSLVAASRLVAVHGEGARRELLPYLRSGDGTQPADGDQRIVAIRLGEGELLSAERQGRARRDVRRRYGIAEDAVLFGCFGGLTPEKRITRILDAMRAIRPHAPSARLILAGARAAHYDVAADIAAHDLADAVTLRDYLEDEAALTDHIAACDVSMNLRWPTARETSGPWLRALAGGRATIVTDLVHAADFASLDPRTWSVQPPASDLRLPADDRHPPTSIHQSPAATLQPPTSTLQPPAASLPPPGSSGQAPICVAIDILDEDHSLRLAMRRLATDAALRDRLGRAAREYWIRQHSVDAMADDYERIIEDAVAQPEPAPALPAHLRNPGDRRLRELLPPFGLADRAPFG